MRKRYDAKLHKASRPAEKKIMAFLNANASIFGATTHVGDTDYAKDGTSNLFDFEVEMRPGHWPGHRGEFPYRTVTIPLRKVEKLLPHTLYFVVRDDLGRTLMLTAQDILTGKTIVKDTKYTKAETFKEIPREKGKYFEL